MLHIAFIHGHAHWPPLLSEESVVERDSVWRQYYGSFQLAVFDGPRVWRKDVHDLVPPVRQYEPFINGSLPLINIPPIGQWEFRMQTGGPIN
jgi:hypothetical protein